MWYRLFKYVVVGPALWLLCRPRVVGAEHIPDSGAVIIAANHCAFIDSFLLCMAVRRPISFVAKNSYFDRRDVTGRLQRWFFISTGQIPLDRGGGARSANALAVAGGVLDRGAIWAIHPEGTRSTDGLVHRGHTGAMRVARTSGVPVIPIALRGTARINPPGTRRLRPGRVCVVVGRPISAAEIEATDSRSATDRLMREIAVLAGQDYRDEYARH